MKPVYEMTPTEFTVQTQQLRNAAAHARDCSDAARIADRIEAGESPTFDLEVLAVERSVKAGRLPSNPSHEAARILEDAIEIGMDYTSPTLGERLLARIHTLYETQLGYLNAHAAATSTGAQQ